MYRFETKLNESAQWVTRYEGHSHYYAKRMAKHYKLKGYQVRVTKIEGE